MATQRAIEINGQSLPVREYQGQRVLTIQDVAMVHNTSKASIQGNFTNNKKQFIEGTDYFHIVGKLASSKLGFASHQCITQINVFTASGYALLCKSMRDRLAWKPEILLKEYFEVDYSGMVFDTIMPVQETQEIVRADFNGFNVRFLMKDDEVWFVGKDVADILGYEKQGKMYDRLDDDERLNQTLQFGASWQKAFLINESGLYNAILGSKKPNAKMFKKWITSKVLPSIRKHGRYDVRDSVKANQEIIPCEVTRVFDLLEESYKKVIYYRLEKGLTQAETSKVLAVSKTKLEKMEANLKNAGLPMPRQGNNLAKYSLKNYKALSEVLEV